MHDIIIAVIGCGVINVIVTAIIGAWNNRQSRLTTVESKLNSIEHKLDTTEKDAIRTQLLLMLSDYPDNTDSILTLAEYYFVTLKSNWYVTALFNNWLEDKGIAKPEWFKGGEQYE